MLSHQNSRINVFIPSQRVIYQQHTAYIFIVRRNENEQPSISKYNERIDMNVLVGKSEITKLTLYAETIPDR